ncbi:MAG TPA: hypothetical protein VF334_03195 [Polyangia bacterium]
MRGVLIALVLVGGVARADQPGARAHFLAGLELYNEGKYSAALAEYQAAWVTWEDPELLLDMAECNRHLGKLDEAREQYRGFLERAPQSPLRGSVERQLARLDALPADAPPPAELVVVAAPSTAAPVEDRTHAGRTAKAIGLAGWLTSVATLGISLATWQLSTSAQSATHADLVQLEGSNGYFSGDAAAQSFYANPSCSPPSSLSNTGRYVSDCNRGQQLSSATAGLLLTSLFAGVGGTVSYLVGVHQAARAGAVEVRPAISLSEATLTLRFPF